MFLLLYGKKINVKGNEISSKWNITFRKSHYSTEDDVNGQRHNRPIIKRGESPTSRRRDRNLLPTTEIDPIIVSFFFSFSPDVSLSLFDSFSLSCTPEWVRPTVSVWLHLTRTTRRPELAIQVFKGHYKSDKPDGVIPSGEAEVRHYAMETSISGGIVATICFSLSARPLPPHRRAAGGTGPTAATLFFCRKTDGKFRGPDTPTF